MRRLVALLGLAACLGVACGAVALWAYQRESPIDGAAISPDWKEAVWPLPRDQWSSGKFFLCDKDHCGTEVKLYVRAKIGFCKCDVGVDDDEELDRIGDVALFSDKPVALAPGHEVAVAWMKGRSRIFSLRRSVFGNATALSVGLNDHCDAIVATAVTNSGQVAVLEPALLKFLNSDVVLHWAKVTLGL